ncbi:hypothetical protein ACLOJK_034516 [Asimina triloba]
MSLCVATDGPDRLLLFVFERDSSGCSVRKGDVVVVFDVETESLLRSCTWLGMRRLDLLPRFELLDLRDAMEIEGADPSSAVVDATPAWPLVCWSLPSNAMADLSRFDASCLAAAVDADVVADGFVSWPTELARFGESVVIALLSTIVLRLAHLYVLDERSGCCRFCQLGFLLSFCHD